MRFAECVRQSSVALFWDKVKLQNCNISTEHHLTWTIFNHKLCCTIVGVLDNGRICRMNFYQYPNLGFSTFFISGHTDNMLKWSAAKMDKGHHAAGGELISPSIALMTLPKIPCTPFVAN